MKVLVIGAETSVGWQLVPALLAEGHVVRCAVPPPVNSPAGLSPAADVVSVDLQDEQSLAQSLAGVQAVFYFVQPDGDGFDFEERERTAARNLAAAAANAGVSRIFFLAGLADDPSTESASVRARHEVSELLRMGATPVTEFRVALVIGERSTSFIMLRRIVERQPLMIMPRWVETRCQPIAVDDIVRYLLLALARPAEGDAVYEIGGPEVMSYRSMMSRYARRRGWRRLMITLPLLTTRLSSNWVDLVTGIPSSVARPLIESLREEAVVRDDTAARLFGPPQIGFEEAIRRASTGREPSVRRQPPAILRHFLGHFQRRLWSPVLTDEQLRPVAADAAAVWRAVVSVGGRKGYPMLDWVWGIRGAIDHLLGGPGLDRHGPAADEVAVGDRLDFWQVMELDPGRRLRMRARMRVPGEAELEIAVQGNGRGSVLIQTARFLPAGLPGRLYWWVLYPVHWLIFRGMAHRLTSRVRQPETVAPR